MYNQKMKIYKKGVQLNYKNFMEDQTPCSIRVIIYLNDWDIYRDGGQTNLEKGIRTEI